MQEIDYVVIGAGMAGLTAGYKLQKEKKSFIILEQKSTPGGRASTEKIDNLNFDLGAAFVMGSYKNLFKIINELNIKVVEKPNYASKIGIIENNKIYSLNANLISLLKFDLLSKKSKFKALLNLPLMLKDLLVNKFSLKTIDENLNDYFTRRLGSDFVKYLIDPITNNLFFYNTQYFSKSLFYKLVNYVKSNTTYYNFENGINEVGNRLAKNLPVKFNSKVISIERKDNNVDISYSIDNQVYKYLAKKVIVALPGNKILDVLKYPEAIEKSFLEQVSYSSTVKVLCSTTENLFNNYDRIFFIEKPNQVLTSINFVEKVQDNYYFTVGISTDFSSKLINENNFNYDYIKSLIKENFEFISEFKIHDISKWKSALPKFSKEYVEALNKFITNQSNIESNIYYAGDYLFGPYIEGAVNSGLTAAENAIKS